MRKSMDLQSSDKLVRAAVGGEIYQENSFVGDSYVIFGSEILEVGKMSDFRSRCEFFGVGEVIDIRGCRLAPGFIDVHIHGFGGCDVMDATGAALETIANSITRHGVTAFLATTITARMSGIESALQCVREYMCASFLHNPDQHVGFSAGGLRQPCNDRHACGVCSEHQSGLEVSINHHNPLRGGARLLGAHLEGPFINKKYCGAQPKQHIALPDAELIERYSDVIKVVTIAPEMPGAIEIIKKYSDNIRFSLGHSDCGFSEAKEAFSCGASSVTHLFNAMTALHHREPGLVGAALLEKNAFAEFICDNIHIYPELYRLVANAKGADRLMLITDSIRAGGLGDGIYELGGQRVSVSGGICSLDDGSLAGSVLSYDEALRNFVFNSGIDLCDAIKMTSQNQAAYLGLGDRFGSIKPGFAADFVVLDDALAPIITIVGGQVVWSLRA